MALGIVGRKCGMTRLFTEDGTSIPVTVVHVEPNYVCQLKTMEIRWLYCYSGDNWR